MGYKHFIQGREEFIIKLGVEKRKTLSVNFDSIFDKYEIKLKERNLKKLVFIIEKNKVLIYGLKILD